VRKISFIVLIVIGMLLFGCNDENTNTEIAPASRPTFTIERLANVSNLIANITITDILDTHINEDLDIEYTLYQATVNHHFYSRRDYGNVITILKPGTPNWQYWDDPLLEIDKTYLVFLNQENNQYGEHMSITGGSQGRYEKEGDKFVRILNLDGDGFEEVTERQFFEAISERNDKIDFDLSILD